MDSPLPSNSARAGLNPWSLDARPGPRPLSRRGSCVCSPPPYRSPPRAGLGLGWAALGWAGLGWAGLGGLVWAGWLVLDWLGWAGLASAGLPSAAPFPFGARRPSATATQACPAFFFIFLQFPLTPRAPQILAPLLAHIPPIYIILIMNSKNDNIVITGGCLVFLILAIFQRGGALDFI